MDLTVGTWNICAQTSGKTDRKAALLGLEAWDVMLLQEVRHKAFEELAGQLDLQPAAGVELASRRGVPAVVPAEWKGSAALGIALRDPGWGGRSHGAAVLLRDPWRLVDVGLLPLGGRPAPDVALHARAMWCRITNGRRDVMVLSVHAHDAAGDGDRGRSKKNRKMRQFRAIESWAAKVDIPLVIGMDINGWHDFATTDDFTSDDSANFDDQARFLAPGASHGLVDVAREVLLRDPERLARRRALSAVAEDGALEVTYSRWQGKVNRMDRIFVSSDFTPRDVRTLYSDGLTAGSDHAMVLADLRLK